MATVREFDPARQRLLSRIHRRGFQTVTKAVSVGGGLTVEFTRITDPDRVLDQVAEAEDRREKVTGRRSPEDQLHLPYWAELWDSAVGLARFLVMANPPPMSPGASVLDLGCGMGLAGTVAAALGGRVLFADLEEPALLFARLNSLPYRDRVRARRLNWQADRLAERFDLILGADILYERRQWEFLEPFWRAHVAPGGSVLLGEPGRQTGDMFVDWIGPRGWKLNHAEQAVETRPKPVRVLQLAVA